MSVSSNDFWKCQRCGGTGTVNLGTNSDAEYHPCPVCNPQGSRS